MTRFKMPRYEGSAARRADEREFAAWDQLAERFAAWRRSQLDQAEEQEAPPDE